MLRRIMLNPVWKSPSELDHQLPSHHDSDNSLMSQLGLRNVVIFCSTRVWRGGFRLLLQASALFFAVFLLFGLLPARISGGSFHHGFLSWGSEPLPEANLRIVVFGSPDIMGSATDASRSRRTWTEELCEELNCTSHISLVPSGGPSKGLVNSTLYEVAIQKLLDITRHTDVHEKPALDYDYLSHQYPAPFQVPSLADQVQEFLAMPSPEATPRETLWIFTFGAWEIWNMASMPREHSEEIIEIMTEEIIEQAEVLYRASLDPKSVAYSDFWTNATESQVKELTAPGAIEKVDERRFESFRIVIPTLFDISMTPGWNGRPKAPSPNSIAEQTRNAAELTKHWNTMISFAISQWRDKGTQKPDGLVEEKSEKSSKAKRDDTASNAEHTNETEKAGDRVILAPYPLRTGFKLNPVRPILDAMTEEEMQRLKVADSLGRGTLSSNDSMRFTDVWTPCVKGKTDDLVIETKQLTAECQAPDDHLFYDSFTISERAMKGAVKIMAEDVHNNMFDLNIKKGWWGRRT
ncbi:hypothetical protein NCS52_00633900 [Fusarium sp. LHS14.1]|nr:hypothetical protein NCS52_00633900 [Fusarium sp. LHS14.1]